MGRTASTLDNPGKETSPWNTANAREFPFSPLKNALSETPSAEEFQIIYKDVSSIGVGRLTAKKPGRHQPSQVIKSAPTVIGHVDRM